MESVEKERYRQNEREHVPTEVRAEVYFPDSVEAKRTADQKSQHTMQKVIAVAAWGAFVAALAYVTVAGMQFREMREQTAQLFRQAEVENAGASHRAVEVDRQLKIAEQQAEAALGQARAAAKNAKAAENNVVAVRKGIEESSKRSKEALEATIDNFHQEQRAWVGIIGVNTEGGVADNDSFAFKSVQAVIRNSGKTPALKLSGECCMIDMRKWDDPIPDYDTEVREGEKKRIESRQQFQMRMEERTKQHPEMAAQIGDFMKRFDDMQSPQTSFIHQGGVLAPEVVQTINLFPSMKTSTRQPVDQAQGGMPGIPAPPMTIYLLGKFTYNDIYPGTPRRSTKFCLMRAGGTTFTICPENNWMD